MASLMAQQVKNLPVMQVLQETWVQSLGWDHPLEEEMATHSSILAWKIPQRNLAVYCPRGHEESDTTEQLSIQRTPLEK